MTVPVFFTQFANGITFGPGLDIQYASVAINIFLLLGRSRVASKSLGDGNARKIFIFFQYIEEFPEIWMARINMELESTMPGFNIVINTR